MVFHIVDHCMFDQLFINILQAHGHQPCLFDREGIEPFAAVFGKIDLFDLLKVFICLEIDDAFDVLQPEGFQILIFC